MRRAEAKAKGQTPPGLYARRAALWVREQALEPHSVLSELFAQAERHYMLAGADRGFLRALVLATLRERRTFDAMLARLMDRPLAPRRRRVRLILHLGLAQIFTLSVPPHAAVATSVELARRAGRPHAAFAPLVNAVLRRAVREKDALSALRAQADPLDLLPEWLAQRWRRRFGAELARTIARASLSQAPIDLVPRDPPAREKLMALPGARSLPGGVVRLHESGDVRGLPGYEEGRFWVQDWAAALPARLLDSGLRRSGVQPDARAPLIADLCAAPGGKTMQLAAMGWRVLAVDVSPARIARMRENLDRLQLDTPILCADAGGLKLARPLGGVLLDAPCSATGTLRRHPDIAAKRRTEDIAALAERQRSLLENAARLLAPGGLLVYSVCSLEPEEGEEQVRTFLAAHHEFARAPVTADEVFGLEQAVTAEGDVLTHPAMMEAVGGMDGFYVARLVRRR